MINRRVQQLSRQAEPLLQHNIYPLRSGVLVPKPGWLQSLSLVDCRNDDNETKKSAVSVVVPVKTKGSIVTRAPVGSTLSVNPSNIKALTLQSETSVAVPGTGPASRAVQTKGLTVRADFFDKLEKVEAKKLRMLNSKKPLAIEGPPTMEGTLPLLPNWRTSTPIRAKPIRRRRSTARRSPAEIEDVTSENNLFSTALTSSTPADSTDTKDVFEDVTVVDQNLLSESPRAERTKKVISSPKTPRTTPKQSRTPKEDMKDAKKPLTSKKSASPRKSRTLSAKSPKKSEGGEVTPTAAVAAEESGLLAAPLAKSPGLRSVSNSKSPGRSPKSKTPSRSRSRSTERKSTPTSRRRLNSSKSPTRLDRKHEKGKAQSTRTGHRSRIQATLGENLANVSAAGPLVAEEHIYDSVDVLPHDDVNVEQDSSEQGSSHDDQKVRRNRSTSSGKVEKTKVKTGPQVKKKAPKITTGMARTRRGIKATALTGLARQKPKRATGEKSPKREAEKGGDKDEALGKICSAHIILADGRPCTVTIKMKWKQSKKCEKAPERSSDEGKEDKCDRANKTVA